MIMSKPSVKTKQEAQLIELFRRLPENKKQNALQRVLALSQTRSAPQEKEPIK